MTNSAENQEAIIARLQQALEEKERQLAREVSRLEFFTGEARSLIAARIQEAFETGAATAEAAFVAKDGHKTPYLFTGRRTIIDDAPCLVGMAVDLSEQKQMEKELQYLAERLQLMLNNLTIAAHEIDADGTFLLSRGKGLEKLGLQPDQVVGASVFELYREFPTIIEAAHRALAGEAQHFEIEVAGAVWDSNFIPIVNERGEVERVFGTGVDVTEHKRAEQALQRSQTQLRHIIDTVPDGVLLLDTDGQVILANPVAEAYLRLLAPDWENGRLIHLGDRTLVELLTSPPKGLWHEIDVTDRCFEVIARPVENSSDEQRNGEPDRARVGRLGGQAHRPG